MFSRGNARTPLSDGKTQAQQTNLFWPLFSHPKKQSIPPFQSSPGRWERERGLAKGGRSHGASNATEIEDKYFLDIEAGKLGNLRKDLDQKRKEESRKFHKQAHGMKCPKCGSDLVEINYQNIMMDRCEGCQGIWLDHGELELLVKGQAKMTTDLLSNLFG
jgi:hypothetical protein